MSATTVNGHKLNKYSSQLTQVRSQVGSQAMLYGAGLDDEDMKKAQVGIASMGWEGNPCNMHLNALARRVKESVQAVRSGRPHLPHHRRERRHLHGHGGHEGVARLARHDCRFHRDCHARAVVRRQHLAARLRQEHARRAHGHGAAQSPQHHDLRRHDQARLPQRQEARHRFGIRSIRPISLQGD